MIQPGEGISVARIQLLKHQAQLSIARHSREDRFQAGQALRIEGTRLCLLQRTTGWLMNRWVQLWLTVTPAGANKKVHSPMRST